MSVTPLNWTVHVDWADDGVFAGSDDISAYVLGLSWNRGRSSVTEDYGAGTASVTLDNSTGLFSPNNSSGALYGSILPGRALRIRTALATVLYFGYVSEITENVSTDGGNTVTLSAVDWFGRLSRGSIRVPVLEDKRVDEILSEIDTMLSVSSGTALATATQTLDFFWSHQSSPLEAFKKAAKQELGGMFYMSKSGVLTFNNRHFRSLKAVSATITGPRMLSLPLRESDIVDKVEFTRAGLDGGTDTEVIYTLFPTGRALPVGSLDPLNTVNGEYPQGAARNVVTPVANTDYTANSAADGSGTDMTASVTVSFTDYGGGFQAVFTNADSNPVYLTLFQVRGDPIRSSAEERRITVENTSAIVRDQTLRDSFEFNDNADAIKAYAEFQLGAMSTALPRGTIELIPRDDTEMAVYLAGELGNRYTVTNTSGLYPSQVNQDFFLEGISGQAIPGRWASFSWTLMHEDLVMGNMFRISGAGTPAYSTINGTDRIGF